MPAYQADGPKFADLNAQVMGISPDSPYCHVAWQRHEIEWMDYPLLSDFYPHGEVAGKYGVRRENPIPLPGISERAVFVVDKKGRVAYAKIYPIDRQPATDEVFEVLRKL